MLSQDCFKKLLILIFFLEERENADFKTQWEEKLIITPNIVLPFCQFSIFIRNFTITFKMQVNSFLQEACIQITKIVVIRIEPKTFRNFQKSSK